MLNRIRPALLIGNGINLYTGCGIRWRDLLVEIAPEMSCLKKDSTWNDISETECYELIKMRNNGEPSVSSRVLDIIKRRKHEDEDKVKTLRSFFSTIKGYGTPILTTNIDSNIEKLAGIKIVGSTRPFLIEDGFSSYTYPWSMYFSDKESSDPFHSFSVWHINGMWCYSRSLKFGLAEYLNNMRRANVFLSRSHNDISEGNPNLNLYQMRYNFEQWAGAKTWLRFFFDGPLIIIGLNLGVNEVFLRWLLIQRKKFFDESKRQGFERFSQEPSIHLLWPKCDSIGDGQKLFFQEVGISIHYVQSYEAIYTHNWEEYFDK